jgi:hypothetical protein
MFISIFRRDMAVEEAEAGEEEEEALDTEEWDTEEEEGLAWGTEVGDTEVEEDTMAAQEEVFSTTQPISKITTRLMYTFIRCRPPM